MSTHNTSTISRRGAICGLSWSQANLHEIPAEMRQNSDRWKVRMVSSRSPTGHLSSPCLGRESSLKIKSLGRTKLNKITLVDDLWRARSRLYRSRFLRPNTHFSAFFEIYKIHTPLHLSNLEFEQFNIFYFILFIYFFNFLFLFFR